MSTPTPGSPQSVVILGSTGSIGESTLDVIHRNSQRFEVLALTANRHVERLADQCKQFGAKYAAIGDVSLSGHLQTALSDRNCGAKVLAGEDGLAEAASLSEANIVMAGIVGAAGLKPTLCAVKAGKKVLLANKESLVIAGPIFMQAVIDSDTCLLPVDSEHNAIFQALPVNFDLGLSEVGVERIILTASGGPFLDMPADRLSKVTPEQACNHPNWDMGRKISVDSATLMNKGLELIEARWLFNATPDQLEVVVHPQSIVHSMVAYRDGSVLAQMGAPDMRTPIAYALAWPERIEAGVNRLNLAEMNDLSFQEPDLKRFPCLRLAFEAMKESASMPITLNAANEIAVDAFLNKDIQFNQIPEVVSRAMECSPAEAVQNLDEVMELDAVARKKTQEIVNKLL